MSAESSDTRLELINKLEQLPNLIKRNVKDVLGALSMETLTKFQEFVIQSFILPKSRRASGRVTHVVFEKRSVFLQMFEDQLTSQIVKDSDRGSLSAKRKRCRYVPTVQ